MSFAGGPEASEASEGRSVDGGYLAAFSLLNMIQNLILDLTITFETLDTGVQQTTMHQAIQIQLLYQLVYNMISFVIQINQDDPGRFKMSKR